MKGLKVILLNLSLLVTVGSLAFGAVFEDDFESGDKGWNSKHYRNASKSEIVAEGKDGGSCFEITGATGDVAWELTSPEFPVEGGASYKVTFDAKHNYNIQKLTGHKDSYWTEMIWYDTNKSKISTSRVRGFDGLNPNWHQDSASGLVAPANAKYARFQFGANYPCMKTHEYIIIDNFKVEKQ